MKSASEKSSFSGIQRIVCALIAVFMVATVFAASVADYDATEEIVVLDDEVTEENVVFEEEVTEELNINVELENEVEEPNVIVEPENEDAIVPNVAEEPEEESEEPEEPEVPNPQPLAGPIELVLGTDSDQYPGQGMGYLYKSGTTYRSYDRYSMYSYVSGSTRENRGWAVYDLSDLEKYTGATITSGTVLWRHDYRYRVTQLDFWTMESIPRDGVSGTTAKGWFEEVGGPGSVKLGENTFSGSYNSNNFDVSFAISSAGITWLNSKLSSGDTDIAFGADVSSLYSGTYGYIYCYDVRLVLDITYTGAALSGEVAVGDELSGYAYRTGSNYDIGRLYTSSSYYGAYAVWDPDVVMGMIPSDGQQVLVNSVSVRLNSPYGYLATLRIHHMAKDPRIASGQQLYDDAFDGTKYYEIATGGYTSQPAEHEWNLGSSGLADFIDTLDGSPNFFAIGFSRTSNYNYMYSPKLVIEYDILGVGGPTAEAGPDMTSNEGDTVLLDGSASTGNASQIVTYEWDFESDGVYDYSEGVQPPTDKEIRLGADNPEYDGMANGYTYRSSSGSYYMYSYYYTYAYWRSTYERRGWAVFDLEDLTEWSGVTVTGAKLLIHNYYRYYADEVGFTMLDTTPYYGSPSSVTKDIFDESGPSGTQIGMFDSTSTYDTSRHGFEVALNANAVSEINAILSGSPTYYTFPVGIYVDSVHPGYSYGYIRWTDVRLVLAFDATDLQNTQSGDGVAFGDDWAGYIYRSSSGSTYNYPYGYMYFRSLSTYSYRGYSQWDVESISDNLPNNVEIKKVGLRLNHRYYSMNSIYVYPMTYDVRTASPADVFTDAGDGTPYSGPNSVGSSFNEYDWDLGPGAVNDLQNAISGGLDYFGLGFMTTSTSGYVYEYGHRLVIEWDSIGGGGVADGKVDYAFGDNGVYTVTLRVTDAIGLKDTDTCVVTVSNVAPTIAPFGPFTVNEGVPLNVATDATDPGSDDLTFVWEFELSSTYTNVYYNGVGPDPYPSPRGTFPFSVTDMITHTHGDDGVYNLILTVTDDDGGTAVHPTTLTVNNVAPTVAPFGPFTLNEGSLLTIDAITTDLGSDDLTFEWEFELGPSFTTTYYNDGTGPDPARSPWGLFPISVTDTVAHTYGDNGVYDLTMTVTDDDGASFFRATTITVNNVAPSVSLYAYVELEFTLRVSGEKWHNVELYVLDNGHGVGYANVLRMPGDPDDQSVTVTGVRCDVTKRVTTQVLYTPFDDPINGQINGADPAWVTMKFQNDEEITYDHTFNYNHPEGWTWITPVNSYFSGHELNFEGIATDVGSDDMVFRWVWGDGSPDEGDMYYNDGVGPDPTISPDGNFPCTVGEYRTHTYWTPVNHTMKLIVQDDDGGTTEIVVTIILA